MGVMERRKRRAFTKEFKAETVRLVAEGGRSVPEVARNLDLTESALRQWVRQAEVDAGRGKPGELTTAEREELQRLRREVKTLRLEREILKNLRAPRHVLLDEKLPSAYLGDRPRGVAVCLLVLPSPKKNMVRGWLRT